MSSKKNMLFGEIQLYKFIARIKMHVYLSKYWTIKKGTGYYCQVYKETHEVGYGFDKNNKFTAIKNAIENAKLFPNN